jgi:hypothetical protein
MTETGSEIWYNIRKPFGYAIIITFFAVFGILPMYSLIMNHGQTEAYSFLDAIATDETAQFQEKGKYSDNFQDMTLSGQRPLSYVLFLSPTEYIGDPGNLGLKIPLNFKQYGVPEPGVTDDGYIVVAIGNIDFDKSLDILWMNQNKQITVIYNDPGYMNNLKDILKRNW